MNNLDVGLKQAAPYHTVDFSNPTMQADIVKRARLWARWYFLELVIPDQTKEEIVEQVNREMKKKTPYIWNKEEDIYHTNNPTAHETLFSEVCKAALYEDMQSYVSEKKLPLREDEDTYSKLGQDENVFDVIEFIGAIDFDKHEYVHPEYKDIDKLGGGYFSRLQYFPSYGYEHQIADEMDTDRWEAEKDLYEDFRYYYSEAQYRRGRNLINKYLLEMMQQQITLWSQQETEYLRQICTYLYAWMLFATQLLVTVYN